MNQALIFDLGNVVFKISFDYTFHYWAKAANVSFEHIKARYQFDEYYDKFERAEITPLEFKNHLIKKLEVQFKGNEFEEGWNQIYDEVFPEMPALLKTLSQRYRVVALTNTNAAHYPVWAEKYAATLPLFERVFCSHHIKHRKPEPAAYHYVLDYLKMKPEQMWFFDDNPDNTQAAQALGIHAVLVTSFEQMIGEMKKQGVL